MLSKSKMTPEMIESDQKWMQQLALMEAIVLSFDLPLLYDYDIPPYYDVLELARKYRSTLPDGLFKEQLKEVVCEPYDNHSELQYFIAGYPNSTFGTESFIGYGQLHRWRPGERRKAKRHVAKYLTEIQKQEIVKLQEAIKIRKNEGGFKKMISNIGEV